MQSPIWLDYTNATSKNFMNKSEGGSWSNLDPIK